VHNGATAVAKPEAANCFDNQLLNELDNVLQSLGWIEQGGGVGYA
jgi:hypothetical protein